MQNIKSTMQTNFPTALSQGLLFSFFFLDILLTVLTLHGKFVYTGIIYLKFSVSRHVNSY